MAGNAGNTAKTTSPLRVLCQSGLAENRFNIHPNDGFDLGLMTTHYSVEVDGGQAAEVWLLNECPKECVQLNSHAWEKLGKPKSVILRYDGKALSFDKA